MDRIRREETEALRETVARGWQTGKSLKTVADHDSNENFLEETSSSQRTVAYSTKNPAVGSRRSTSPVLLSSAYGDAERLINFHQTITVGRGSMDAGKGGQWRGLSGDHAAQALHYHSAGGPGAQHVLGSAAAAEVDTPAHVSEQLTRLRNLLRRLKAHSRPEEEHSARHHQSGVGHSDTGGGGGGTFLDPAQRSMSARRGAEIDRSSSSSGDEGLWRAGREDIDTIGRMGRTAATATSPPPWRPMGPPGAWQGPGGGKDSPCNRRVRSAQLVGF